MRFDHDPHCVHCQMGCDHDHDSAEVEIDLALTMPVVRGSRMRHGGVLEDPATGLSVASNNWLPVRCMFCSAEAMTPAEVIPPWWPANQAPDGVRLGVCGGCQSDMDQGHRPGHNPHRRRRGSRHG